MRDTLAIALAGRGIHWIELEGNGYRALDRGGGLGSMARTGLDGVGRTGFVFRSCIYCFLIHGRHSCSGIWETIQRAMGFALHLLCLAFWDCLFLI